MEKAAIGLVGLGVMGQSLALNIERNGFTIAVFNHNTAKMQAFIDGVGAGKNFIGAETPQKLIKALKSPRVVLLMVPAGAPVDEMIDRFTPLLDPGDILIDGGNSLFSDTNRRAAALAEKGLLYLGMGVSGGEEGALWGPSLMPGGDHTAYDAVEPVLKAIAAKAPDGEPCAAFIGPRGAGHYVKMVHNGIEYGDMQLIAEVYDVLHRGLGLSNAELHQVFAAWNRGRLKSYLIEITADIFTRDDPETGFALVDLILDEAAQKGTGKWTSQNALEIGAPTPPISAGVEARLLSALKEERVAAAKVLTGPRMSYTGSRQGLIDAAEAALYASKVTSYAQGLGLLRLASNEYHYEIRLEEVVKIWRAGCIIRADLLEEFRAAYQRNPDLQNLLLDETINQSVENSQDGWRYFIQTAVSLGIPVLGISASLAYYDSYRSDRLPANLLQAQRDYFGAHTYRRVDRPGDFHTRWTD